MGNNIVTQEHIDNLIRESQINVKTVFGKCTIVSVQLKNGFVIVESNTCVNPINYDEAMGIIYTSVARKIFIELVIRCDG